MKPRQVFLALALLALAGCTSAASTRVPPVVPASTIPGVTPASSGLQSSAAPSAWPANWTLPDFQLTPGALQPGLILADLCPHVSPALEAQRPSSGAKRVVYAQYGIVHHAPGAWEIDHLIPIELGGLAGAPASHVTENLWPEPNTRPDPAMIARYHLDPAYVKNPKDLLEDVLHKDVCAGTVPLPAAQRAIAADWRQAYVTYVGKPA